MRMTIAGVAAWLAVAAAWGDEPKPTAAKPPYERVLAGKDAERAAELGKRVDELSAEGRFADGVGPAEELAALRARVQGADHWEAVSARWSAAGVRTLAGLPADKRAGWQGAEQAGAEAAALQSRGKYAEAEPLYRKAAAGRRAALGAAHPYAIPAAVELAVNLDGQGRHADAEPLHRAALGGLRAALGEAHPDTARAATLLAQNLSDQGRRGEAEALHRQALGSLRTSLGDTHRDTVTAYRGLADALSDLGRHSEAEPLCRKALEVSRAVAGDGDPAVGHAYNTLAANLMHQGRYTEAEPLLRTAVELWQRTLGDAHPETALGYLNLAEAVGRQNKHAEAEPLVRRALDAYRAAHGESHPSTAGAYNNLAVNLSGQGRFADAEPPARKALAFWQAAQGESHPATAQAYNNLAAALTSQGRYADAEPFHRRALAAAQATLGPRHPNTATALGTLASNLGRQKRYADAEPLQREALAAVRAARGEGHPETARAYNDLAYSLDGQGRHADALPLYEAAARSYEAARLAAAAGLARAAFGADLSPYRRLAAAYARAGRPADAWTALEAGLARGLLDAAADRRADAPPPAETARRAALAARLSAPRPRLLALAIRPKLDPAEAAEFVRLQADRTAAEAELADLAAASSRREVATLAAVQAALPTDAAVIAWVDFGAAGRFQGHWACVVRRAGDPAWVELPGAGPDRSWTDAEIALPDRFREVLAAGAPDADALTRQLAVQRLAPVTKHLAGVKYLFVVPAGAMAGVPVEALTADYAVSYVPSGTFLARYRAAPKPAGTDVLAVGDPAYARPDVPAKATFADLPPGGLLVTQVVPGGNAAAARLQPGDVVLTYAGAAADDLVKLRDLIAAHGTDATVPVTVWREGQKGAATRDLKPGKLGAVFHPDPAPAAVAARRKADAALVALARGGDWKPLPGTRVELDRLTKLFGAKAEVLAGSDASEQRLDDLRAGGLRRFRYLHFAAHGEADGRRAFESALILAQDRLPKDVGKGGERFVDGKLTANEVLADWTLDAELVTLSACETALGRQGGGDGLLGFAQAFLAAGSRAVCLSLWKVDDAATALLMDRFYANLVTRKMGKAAALAEAKRWLRDLPAGAAAERTAELSGGVARGKGETAVALTPPAAAPGRADGRPFAHPKYWAAFVLIGDPD